MKDASDKPLGKGRSQRDTPTATPETEMQRETKIQKTTTTDKKKQNKTSNNCGTIT